MKLNFGFFLFIGFLIGCGSNVEQSMRTLAPQGGEGIKIYRYESGETKIEDEWRNFKKVRSTYFLKDGRVLFDSKSNGGVYVALKLNEDESIAEIIECRNYEKNGLALEIANGKVLKIQQFKDGELISEATIINTAADSQH